MITVLLQMWTKNCPLMMMTMMTKLKILTMHPLDLLALVMFWTLEWRTY